MNIYNFSSGDHDPSNDYIRIHAAMDAGSQSKIKIFNSGSNGVIQYQTSSDYIWKLERVKYISDETVPLSASQSSKMGYPDSMSWIPGEYISPLSNNKNIETGKLNSLTKKSDTDELEYLKEPRLIVEDYYDYEWLPSGLIQVSKVNSSDGNIPFVEIEQNDISLTGSISLTSSSLEGCVFSMDIKKDFISNTANKAGSLILPEKFSAKRNSSQRKEDMLNEWNSIFEINADCNADSIFRDGENRDSAFIKELKGYIDKNWYGKMKRNLWGDYIDNQNINLSSRDPLILKNHIFYCFYYFGVSDDLYNLASYSYGYQDNGMSWHIGLGGSSNFSDNVRSIKKELSYLPVIKETKEVSKVYGLPLRSAYVYNLQNNLNIADFIGTINEDGTTSENGINSNNY